VAFSGNLLSVSLEDILQLIHLGRKSGVLRVVTERASYSLSFLRGRIVAASAARLVAAGHGADAREISASAGTRLRQVALHVVRLQTGTFSLQPGEPDGASSDHLDVQHLLLEALRESDETAREGAAAHA
jgi:hypothetical protein